jgi:hypothetical protein
VTGVEPATLCLASTRSSQLSYTRKSDQGLVAVGVSGVNRVLAKIVRSIPVRPRCVHAGISLHSALPALRREPRANGNVTLELGDGMLAATLPPLGDFSPPIRLSRFKRKPAVASLFDRRHDVRHGEYAK